MGDVPVIPALGAETGRSCELAGQAAGLVRKMNFSERPCLKAVRWRKRENKTKQKPVSSSVFYAHTHSCVHSYPLHAPPTPPQNYKVSVIYSTISSDSYFTCRQGTSSREPKAKTSVEECHQPPRLALFSCSSKQVSFCCPVVAALCGETKTV